MVEEEEEELKKILNIQNKQINILKDQVKIRSRTKDLVSRIKGLRIYDQGSMIKDL